MGGLAVVGLAVGLLVLLALTIFESRSYKREHNGEERLEAISIGCDATGTVERVPASALFIFIGAEPSTEWLKDFVERDEQARSVTLEIEPVIMMAETDSQSGKVSAVRRSC